MWSQLGDQGGKGHVANVQVGEAWWHIVLPHASTIVLGIIHGLILTRISHFSSLVVARRRKGRPGKA